eukprot:CAMPEP_0182425374 /NCGR_PEP_ID=MMETSP1167-20130531/11784_1 /TAXON_ID=2988 /ORGANISM="Mallomonas Sp, Strain CCMP3275" /LENGTH=406 /DNA_ID=CAMNT_0024606029 /DNA_START=300 /DNA_END=1520 /DNA_ORIENTATION=+
MYCQMFAKAIYFPYQSTSKPPSAPSSPLQPTVSESHPEGQGGTDETTSAQKTTHSSSHSHESSTSNNSHSRSADHALSTTVVPPILSSSSIPTTPTIDPSCSSASLSVSLTPSHQSETQQSHNSDHTGAVSGKRREKDVYVSSTGPPLSSFSETTPLSVPTSNLEDELLGGLKANPVPVKLFAGAHRSNTSEQSERDTISPLRTMSPVSRASNPIRQRSVSEVSRAQKPITPHSQSALSMQGEKTPLAHIPDHSPESASSQTWEREATRRENKMFLRDNQSNAKGSPIRQMSTSNMDSIRRSRTDTSPTNERERERDRDRSKMEGIPEKPEKPEIMSLNMKNVKPFLTTRKRSESYRDPRRDRVNDTKEKVGERYRRENLVSELAGLKAQMNKLKGDINEYKMNAL